MNIEQYERIEAYLKGNLKEGDANSFEQEIQADTLLQEEVEAHRLMHEAIVETNLAQFRESMKMLDPNEVIQTRFWKKVLVVSAGAVGLALMSFVIWNFSDNKPENIKPIVEPILEEKSIAKTSSERSSPISLVERTEIVDTELIELGDAKTPQALVFPKLEGTRLLKSKHRKPAFEVNVKGVSTFKTPDVIGSPITNPIVDCDLELAAISQEIKPSCYGQESGEILFTGSFLEKVDFSGKESNFLTFNELKEGAYEFTLNTKSGCVTKRKVIVESVFCTGDQSFAPSEGQYWSVPTFNLGGNVVVYGLDGKKCFESEFSEGESVEWSGQSTSGKLMPRGEYYYEIQFSNGKQIRDKVSLLF